MAKQKYRTLPNYTVGKLEVGKDMVLWDREITGIWALLKTAVGPEAGANRVSVLPTKLHCLLRCYR